METIKMDAVVLSEDDRKELVQLYTEAQRTPVIGFSVIQMIEGRDLSSLAWDEVRHKMGHLGEKYNFNPKKMKGINKKTGEIIFPP